MNITEFLAARITEDEAEAQVAKAEFAHGGYGCYGPARVLAECAAKRAIIEQSEAANDLDKFQEEDRPKWIEEFDGRDFAKAPYLGEQLLRILAAVYKDHPDYQQEWELAEGEK